MKEKDDLRGCFSEIVKFVKIALRLFVPVALMMAAVVFFSYFTETLTNSSICGVGVLVLIPSVIAYIIFSRIFGNRK